MSADFGNADGMIARAGWGAAGAPLLVDCIERAKSGDEAAWVELVRAHRAQVYRTALRLLGHREDALDASQEVFVRMHRYLNKFDTRRELTPWLYAMTVNVCRDVERTRARNRHRMGDGGNVEDQPVPPLAGRRADAEVEREIMERGLRMLSEGERAAIVLRDIEGLSTREVAEALHVAEVTIRSQISRARTKLRDYRRAALGNDDGV